MKAADEQFFYRTLAGWVAAEDPDRAYWPSSPSSGQPGVIPTATIWATPTSGKSGTRSSRSSTTATNPSRFVSEFGFQALPAPGDHRHLRRPIRLEHDFVYYGAPPKKYRRQWPDHELPDRPFPTAQRLSRPGLPVAGVGGRGAAGGGGTLAHALAAHGGGRSTGNWTTAGRWRRGPASTIMAAGRRRIMPRGASSPRCCWRRRRPGRRSAWRSITTAPTLLPARSTGRWRRWTGTRCRGGCALQRGPFRRAAPAVAQPGGTYH